MSFLGGFGFTNRKLVKNIREVFLAGKSDGKWRFSCSFTSGFIGESLGHIWYDPIPPFRKKSTPISMVPYMWFHPLPGFFSTSEMGFFCELPSENAI